MARPVIPPLLMMMALIAPPIRATEAECDGLPPFARALRRRASFPTTELPNQLRVPAKPKQGSPILRKLLCRTITSMGGFRKTARVGSATMARRYAVDKWLAARPALDVHPKAVNADRNVVDNEDSSGP